MTGANQLLERWSEIVRHHWNSSARMVRRVAEGLSQSVVCEVEFSGHHWCLKGVPQSYSIERLRNTHQLRKAAHAAGLEWVPLALSNQRGDSYVSSHGMLWELSPWLPGEPQAAPTEQQCAAGMRALAQLHRCWEPTAPDVRLADTDSEAARRPRGTVSIVQERLEFAQRCASAAVEHDWDRLAGKNSHFPWANDVRRFVRKSTNYIDRVKNTLLPWVEREVPRQPVLRDIWSDHLFFDENRVCGLIDFHAIGVGTVAGDIGRLLASWQLPDEETTWATALAEYEAIRPLAPEEQALITILDDAARVLTPWVWLTWVILEKREFPIDKMNSRVTWSLRRFFQWDEK